MNEKGSILIYCKKCGRIVDRLSAGKPLPYEYTCPICHTRRKLVRIKHWRESLEKLPSMVATNKRTPFGRKLLEKFGEVELVAEEEIGKVLELTVK